MNHRVMPLAGSSPRPGRKQISRLIADGTGRSEEELQFLVVSTVVSGLVAGAAAAYFGVVRIREFLRDAQVLP